MNDTKQIEDYLNGTLSPEEHLLMQARLLTEPSLNEQMLWQQRSYELVRAYARQQLRAEIASIQKRLFTESRFSSFKKRIQSIFN